MRLWAAVLLFAAAGPASSGQPKFTRAMLGKDIRGVVLNFVSASASTLDIQSPSLGDPGLERDLAQAVSRGVKVRLLLSPASKASRSFAAQNKIAALAPRWSSVDSDARYWIADRAKILTGTFDAATAPMDTRLECLFRLDDVKTAAAWTRRFNRQWDRASGTLPERYRLEDELEALPSPVEPADRLPRLKTGRH